MAEFTQIAALQMALFVEIALVLVPVEAHLAVVQAIVAWLASPVFVVVSVIAMLVSEEEAGSVARRRIVRRRKKLEAAEKVARRVSRRGKVTDHVPSAVVLLWLRKAVLAFTGIPPSASP